MERLRKRFVMLVVPAVLILFVSFLAAQGPPNDCAADCLEAYRNAVSDCHGDLGCLAIARETVEACLQVGCNLPPPR